MTDRPYTDEDLRAEAARQHANLLDEALDFVGVGEALDDAPVASLSQDDDLGTTWDEIVEGEAFGEVQEKVHALIRGAVDVSEWAVNLGADGLQPDEHQLTWKAGEQPIVRVHFAFHEGMSTEARDYLVTAVGEAMHKEMQRAAAVPAADDACGKCRQPFDPADTRHDGRAQHQGSPYCRGCVDRCHESTDAFHVCVICRDPR